MSRRKITFIAKLKGVSQEERIQKWKEHFKNLFGTSQKVIDKLINSQLDSKVGQFMEEKLNIALTKIKNRKAEDLDKIPSELWKTRKFDDQLKPNGG